MPIETSGNAGSDSMVPMVFCQLYTLLDRTEWLLSRPTSAKVFIHPLGSSLDRFQPGFPLVNVFIVATGDLTV